MKLKMYLLLQLHRLLYKLGLKTNPIVKIWYDKELNNVLMFVDRRSGLFTVPCQYTDDLKISEWLASYTAMGKYGMFNGSTIYALKNVI